MGFSEAHQANLQRVLVALSESASCNTEADVSQLKNLVLLSEEFLGVCSEMKKARHALAISEVTIERLETAERDKERQLSSHRHEISSLHADVMQTDAHITALRAELASQKEGFEGILMELKDEMDYKDGLLTEYQSSKTDSQSPQQKFNDMSRLAKRLEEAKRLNKSLSHALKMRDIELENCGKMKGLLNFLNAQLTQEKQTTERLEEEVMRLEEELEQMTRLNASLSNQNKSLERVKYMESMRARHLNVQLERMKSRSLSAIEEISPTEGESLYSFTIDQNKLMEDELINYRRQVKDLNSKLGRLTRQLSSMQLENFQLKLAGFTGKHSSQEVNRLEEIENDANSGRDVMGSPKQADRVRSAIDPEVCSALYGTGHQDSLGVSKQKQADDPLLQSSSMNSPSSYPNSPRVYHPMLQYRPELLRALVSEQDATIKLLLDQNSSLQASLEKLSKSSQHHQAQSETLKASLEETRGRLDAALCAESKRTERLTKEMEWASLQLTGVEEEVRSMRKRITVA
jgi:chromosome segregation ATPase